MKNSNGSRLIALPRDFVETDVETFASDDPYEGEESGVYVRIRECSCTTMCACVNLARSVTWTD